MMTEFRKIDETDKEAVAQRFRELRFMYAQLVDLDPDGAKDVDAESRRLAEVYERIVKLEE